MFSLSITHSSCFQKAAAVVNLLPLLHLLVFCCVSFLLLLLLLTWSTKNFVKSSVILFSSNLITVTSMNPTESLYFPSKCFFGCLFDWRSGLEHVIALWVIGYRSQSARDTTSPPPAGTSSDTPHLDCTQCLCCNWKSIHFFPLISSHTQMDCGPFGISFSKLVSNRTRAKELACLIIDKIFTGLHKIPRLDQ